MKTQSKGQSLAWSIRPFITMPPKSSSDVDIVISDIAKSIDRMLDAEPEKHGAFNKDETYKVLKPGNS